MMSGNETVALKFGMFDHMDASGLDLRQQYTDRLQITGACDRAGFYAYHIAEHHGTPHGYAPSPNLFLAAVAQRTQNLRLSPMVMLLNLYHPLRAFEEICMLDQMSGGRVDLGIGRGVSPIELAFFGISSEAAQDRYREAADIVLEAMKTDKLSYRGQYFELDNVPITLSPIQRPHPPLWYGTTSSETASWAAEHNINIACVGQASAIRLLTDAYRSRWTASVVRPEMPLLGMVRQIVIAETDAEARAMAVPAYARWFETFTHLNRMHGVPPLKGLPSSFEQAAAEGQSLAGSISTVRDALIRQTYEAGVTYLMCHMAFGDLPMDATLNTIAAMESEVMPAFADIRPRELNRRSVASHA